MTKQTLKQFAVSAACLGLALNGTLCAAQLGPPRSNHQPASTTSPAKLQSAQPEGATYTYTLFDFPGTFYTYPSSLNLGISNPKIQIVGQYGVITSALSPNGFLLRGSEGKGVVTESYRTVDFPGVSQQGAFGVNDAGQIVGQYVDSSGIFHGWELSGATFTTIDVPFTGATGTITNGINDAQEIVGCWESSGISQHGFTLIAGTYTSFDYPGALQTCPWAVNSSGVMTGYYTDTSYVLHGFILSGSTFTSIDPPGSVWTTPGGINDAGDVTGGYCTTSACVETLDGSEGFLLSKGSYTTFTIPGAVGTSLGAITNKGVILGGYFDVAGFDHGFVAAP
ncbi:MAG: hypothetical protein WA824_04440 [Candidatus Sulfotelmatobacter sp.]